jgi:hypothetical protein
MPEVVVGLCHGGWSKDDKYVAIPDGTNLFLFQEPGDLMEGKFADEHTYKSADGLKATQGDAFIKLIPGDVIYDFHTSPLSLKEDHPMRSAAQADIVIVDAGKLLSEILAEHKGNNIYWLCCQAFAGVPTNEEDELLSYGRLLTDDEKSQKSEEEFEEMKKAAKGGEGDVKKV